MPPTVVHPQSTSLNADADPRDGWRSQLSTRLPTTRWRTRFAPAPTGYLHLGHLVNALYVWGLARRFGGDVILRIEDHDRSRCRAEYETALLDDLEWLGFAADVAPVDSYRAQVRGHAFRQSDNNHRYQDALDALDAAGMVYPCECTRRVIANQVPHRDGEEPRYPGSCRSRQIEPQSTPARRVAIPDGELLFSDLRLGAISQNPAHQCGDVLAVDRHGHWTYQFTVTVDDIAHGVDVVIRGEDLLPSTARQFCLAELLGRREPPLVLHHPLLVHRNGAKLSKANRDTSLRARRADGASPQLLLGEAAYLAGLTTSPTPMSATEVGSLFA